jgi:hypothetical protein
MDHERFDALSRALASSRPRRGVLGLILSVTLLDQGTSVFAKPGKAKGNGRGKSGGRSTTKRGRPVPNDPGWKTCDDREHACHGDVCCAGGCCPGHCFWDVSEGEPGEPAFCCPKPKDGGIMCTDRNGEVRCCAYSPGKSASENCRPDCPYPKLVVDEVGPTLIAGSYRRR